MKENICPLCYRKPDFESPGFSLGRAAVIWKCEKGHKWGKVFKTPHYLMLYDIGERCSAIARQEEYSGSLKSFGYFGDHVKELYRV